MRCGFTTGSCAAAAAKAAAYMLLTGNIKRSITIETPKGILYNAEILDIRRAEKEVSCAVEKDGGDDPDITTGAWIYVKVSYPKYAQEVSSFGNRRNWEGQNGEGCEKNTEDFDNRKPCIVIEGGSGVGRVTRKGLDQPVGNAAINRVPREMIEKEVLEVCRVADYDGGLKIEISVPDGERLAAQTFNPRLGIKGGISILGTSGVVEPMSTQAVLDTIRVALRQRREEGFSYVAVAPGNYGQDFMRQTYGYDLDRSVKCSNFIGATVDMAVELGFQRILLTGHIGKLIKVSGGIMNTHSKEADCRMELLAAFAAWEGLDSEPLCRIMACATTEEVLLILQENGKLDSVMKRAVRRVCYYLETRAGGQLKADCIIYANEFGELAKSEGVETWFTLLAQEQGRQI